MSRIYYVFALLVGMTLIISWSGNPPDGRTGAPGDGLCSDCHSGGGEGQDGSIVVTGFPSTITPSTAYVLTITNSNPNGMADRAGFQMTVLNSSNDIAGSMTSPSMNSTVTPSGGREYWEHNPAQDYPGNNMVTWNVTWTSPTGPADEVITYYAAGNVANGNGGTSGDLIVTSTGTGMLEGGPDPLMVDIVDVVHVTCFGGSDGSATADATDGTAPYDYLWSDGQTTAMLMDVPAGTYTVTVTDDTGATETASVDIDEPNAVTFNTPVITHISCNGEADGEITASATGGTGAITYAWSNGGSGATISNLTADTYTVTATDANGCTNSESYMINEPDVIEINLVELNHESCEGQQDGSITIETFGGTGVLFAEWSDGSIGNTVLDLAPGDYSVTVTDENSCTQTAAYTINSGGVIDVTLEELVHVTCNGGSDGSITVSASGGLEPYTYTWQDNTDGPTLSNVPAGNYLVTVQDANGCEVVRLYTVNEPDPIEIQINATGENLCATDSLVNLEAIPSGGTAPYTGMWSNGVDGFTNNDLPAGNYTITVTDAAGCTSSESIDVTAPSAVTVSVTTTHETALDANDGTATANPMGGTGAYTYLWSNGETTQMISGLAPGTYTVTVTDANGCTAMGSGQVNAFGCILVVDLGADVQICEGASALLTPTVTGETGGVLYLWPDGSNGPTYEVSTGGEVCVTVTDDSGCQSIDCINVSVLMFPLITCPVVNESAPGMNDGSIMCDSTSGSIIYLWSTGETTPGISGLAPDDYCVTMTDQNGCEAVQCFTVQPAGCMMTVTGAVMNVLCNGDANGSITLMVENATDPVTYIWSNGETTSSIGNLSGGEYDVTTTDAAGCEVESSYIVMEPDPLVITVDTVIHITGDPGSILITVEGGVEPYAYQWSDANGNISSEEDLEGITNEGYYDIDVVDANGCAVNMDSIYVGSDVAVRPNIPFKELKVYPVPTQDFLTIDYENQITEVIISGIDGRTHSRILNPSSNRLDVGALEAGMYVLRMTDGESWFIARIVK